MRRRDGKKVNDLMQVVSRSRLMALLIPALAFCLISQMAAEEAASQGRTKVVMLGTGTPLPDPDRSGPAVAVVVNGSAYLVDCGVNVVRRAAAGKNAGIEGLEPKDLKIVFITHLHSDHTLGYPDLIFTPWVMERTEPLSAYGPRGLRKMTQHIQRAWDKDIYVRTHGLEKANKTGYRVVVHEIAAGMVYRDANVTVTAFAVKHGSWDQAFGYRFDTTDRRIVISGDTAPTDEVVKACAGCDVLLHEVYDPNREKIRDSEQKQEYFHAFHTSPQELGEIAARAHPKLLVLYHQVMGERPEPELIEQMKRSYSGKFVSARDLDVY
ncbi:MAG TPA: MBL fold metallo-hydrolase [Terriglobales bacterium]|nr:MBL fold metallo-hydrolase [Terriglobales bacterium]